MEKVYNRSDPPLRLLHLFPGYLLEMTLSDYTNFVIEYSQLQEYRPSDVKCVLGTHTRCTFRPYLTSHRMDVCGRAIWPCSTSHWRELWFGAGLNAGLRWETRGTFAAGVVLSGRQEQLCWGWRGIELWLYLGCETTEP